MKWQKVNFSRLAKTVANFKSHWYYWYTGQKAIAVVSMLVSLAALALGLVLTVGCSIWGVVVAILLDSVGLWLAILYWWVARDWLPALALDPVDALILTHLLVPILCGFFIVRISTFWVAKVFAAQIGGSKTALKHAEPSHV